MKLTGVVKGGVIELDTPASLAEGTRVTVDVPEAAAGNGTSRPWSDVVGILPDADAREMRAIIDQEFERVDANGW